MTPRALPAVHKVLNTITLPQAQHLAALALAAPTAQHARDTTRNHLPILTTLGL
jgi:phosphotransferase system enzyme I (PtsI)